MHLGIHDPPDPVLRRRLRSVVLAHGETEHHRVFDPTLHLESVHCVLDRTETWDDALHADVAAALLRRKGHPATEAPWLAWLTRTGDLETQDIDLAVVRSVRTACAEAGPLAGDFHLVVVNRRAWRDPVTGVGQEWKRLRDRHSVRHTAMP